MEMVNALRADLGVQGLQDEGMTTFLDFSVVDTNAASAPRSPRAALNRRAAQKILPEVPQRMSEEGRSLHAIRGLSRRSHPRASSSAGLAIPYQRSREEMEREPWEGSLVDPYKTCLLHH